MAVQRVYIGVRERDGCKVWRLVEGKWSALPPCHSLRNHSPDGFNWGYGGSGPTQLCLALCVDVLFNPKVAEEVYQAAKRDLLRYLDGSAWLLTEYQVRDIITPHVREAVDNFPLGVWARKIDRPDAPLRPIPPDIDELA